MVRRVAIIGLVFAAMAMVSTYANAQHNHASHHHGSHRHNGYSGWQPAAQPWYGPHNGNVRHYHSRPAYHGNYYNYNSWKEYANEYYPRYYGGLHSRQFYNIGIPTGDIGLRGTPW